MERNYGISYNNHLNFDYTDSRVVYHHEGPIINDFSQVRSVRSTSICVIHELFVRESSSISKAVLGKTLDSL